MLEIIDHKVFVEKKLPNSAKPIYTIPFSKQILLKIVNNKLEEDSPFEDGNSDSEEENLQQQKKESIKKEKEEEKINNVNSSSGCCTLSEEEEEEHKIDRLSNKNNGKRCAEIE